MSRPKQHHYVPSSYLNGFTGIHGKLRVYTRNESLFRTSIPRKVASIRNFYSVKKPSGEYCDDVELFLSDQVESPALPAIRKLSESQQLNWEERIAISRFVAFQESRTPIRRADMEAFPAKLMTMLMEMMARRPGAIEEKIEELKSLGKWDSQVSAEELRQSILDKRLRIASNPSLSLVSLMQSETAVPYYAQFRWRVLLAPRDGYFLTSDHPVMKEDPGKSSPYRFGLMSPTLAVSMPLTKKALLVMTPDHQKVEQFVDLMDQGKHALAEELQQQLPEIEFIDGRLGTVTQANLQVISSAPKLILAPSHNEIVPIFFVGEPSTLRLVSN